MVKSNHNYNPVKVYSTFVPSDLLLAKMVLEQEGIQYETRNENFAALYPMADGLGTVDILVDKADVERAGKILKPFIKGKK